MNNRLRATGRADPYRLVVFGLAKRKRAGVVADGPPVLSDSVSGQPATLPVRQPSAYVSRTNFEYGTALTTARISICL